MHTLSASFIEKLTAYDPALGAVYDGEEDAIFIHARRQGQKVHELTVRREYAENYEELEGRTIKKLAECDVWKRFGSAPNPGKAYDDWLDAEETRYREAKKKEIRERRIQIFKENRDIFAAAAWNAAHGRFTAREAHPYKTPFISMHVSTSKSNGAQRGYTINDKRGTR